MQSVFQVASPTERYFNYTFTEVISLVLSLRTFHVLLTSINSIILAFAPIMSNYYMLYFLKHSIFGVFFAFWQQMYILFVLVY